MTPEDLRRIADTPGYGTGEATRDRLAALAECRALLPDPRRLPVFIATGSDPFSHPVPMAHFGNSSEDGKDWSICHDGTTEADAIGQDARDDAQIVAAILNAYRLGLLVVKK